MLKRYVLAGVGALFVIALSLSVPAFAQYTGTQGVDATVCMDIASGN